jgi:nucleotide-binding universal stress UspA family protein
MMRTDSKFFVSKEIGATPHKSIVLDGDPATRIVECATELKANLIVMPTYHGLYRTLLIGSVTAKVLHDFECPVLTGVHHYDESFETPDAFRNIVCALDDSPGCVPLFRWARQLSGIFGARLKCVHAIPAVDETSENRGEVMPLNGHDWSTLPDYSGCKIPGVDFPSGR